MNQDTEVVHPEVPFSFDLAFEVPDSVEFEEGVGVRDTITWDGPIPHSDDD